MTTPPPSPPPPTDSRAGAKRLLASDEPVGGRTRLVGGMAATLAGTAALAAGIIGLADRPHWWRGFVAATVIGLFAAGLSLLPLLWGMRRGPGKAVLGFFVAGGLRAAVALGGGLIAARLGGYPLQSTLLLVVAYYLAALAVEATVLARALWSMKL